MIAIPLIVYRKQSIRIAEVFSADASLPANQRVDILRFRDCVTPVPGTVSYSHPTLQIDLRKSMDEILSGMRKRARRKIRAGENAGFACEIVTGLSTAAWLEHFFAFFDRFAASRSLPPANRERLTTMAAAGLLGLTRVRDRVHGVLVYHAYTLSGTVANLLHSASLFREREGDSAYAETVSNANGWLHWQDMQYFRNGGMETYDFGSWHTGNDPDLLKLNVFKHSFGGTVVDRYFADRGVTVKGKIAVHARKLQGRLRGNR